MCLPNIAEATITSWNWSSSGRISSSISNPVWCTGFVPLTNLQQKKNRDKKSKAWWLEKNMESSPWSLPAVHCHGLFYVKGVSPIFKRRITSKLRASLTFFFTLYRTLLMDICQILEHGRFKWMLWHMS